VKKVKYGYRVQYWEHECWHNIPGQSLTRDYEVALNYQEAAFLKFPRSFIRTQIREVENISKRMARKKKVIAKILSRRAADRDQMASGFAWARIDNP
jgi:hypothetical protein